MKMNMGYYIDNDWYPDRDAEEEDLMRLDKAKQERLNNPEEYPEDESEETK
jgi:hypothetical protein